MGAGYAYGTLGPTHHALEDATILATLPDMWVLSPGTLGELERLYALVYELDGPVYFRLGRENGPDLSVPDFELDSPVVRVNRGGDINIVTSGTLLGECLTAAEQLGVSGVQANVVSISVLAPFPKAALADVLVDAPTISVFEGLEGNPLECGVMRSLLQSGGGNHGFRALNAGRTFAKRVGRTEALRAAAGLDSDAVVGAVQLLVNGRR